jgi:hypothetical protein
MVVTMGFQRKFHVKITSSAREPGKKRGKSAANTLPPLSSTGARA